MKANLDSIADKLGVSKSTVSRALRNHPAISAETRARVVEAASRLGYEIKQSRRGRKKIRDEQVAHFCLLVAGEEARVEQGSLHHKLLAGVTDTIESLDMFCTTHFYDEASLSRHDLPLALRQGKCKGAIFVGRFPADFVKRISQQVPCVSLNYRYDIANMDFICAEDSKAIDVLVKHLYQNGHRRIGFIEVEQTHPRVGERFGAFVRSMTGLGLKPDWEALIIDNDMFPEASGKAERALQLTKQGITAWVCGSDFVAFAVLEHFSQHGFDVPRDVSITGFGAVTPAKPSVPLCTMAVPFYEIGAEGARQLVERMSSPSRRSRHVFLDCKLLEGESVKKSSSN